MFSVHCVAHSFLQCTYILPCSKSTVSSVCVQCGAHGVRASLDPSWFFVGRRTFTSGIWRMGRGNTDRHAHTNRQMNTHEPNTVGRSEKHTKTDEPTHMSAKSNWLMYWFVSIDHSKERQLFHQRGAMIDRWKIKSGPVLCCPLSSQLKLTTVKSRYGLVWYGENGQKC